jgi:hypothetical protein
MIVGRTIARGLTSLIPIFGNVIDGAVASKVTYTLGMQYIKMCGALLERFPSGDVPAEVLQQAIRALLDRRDPE